jgi:hypothetical protein
MILNNNWYLLIFDIANMSSESLYSRVPFEMGHTHFLNSIEAFPQLQSGPSFEQR